MTKRATPQRSGARPLVLLACTVGDEAIVRPLIEALHARGLSALTIHNGAELHKYRHHSHYLLVVWTLGSLNSAELYEVARTQAIDACLLSDGLPAEAIPAAARRRCRSIFQIDDIDRILQSLEPTYMLFMTRRQPTYGTAQRTEEEKKQEAREVGALKAASGRLVYAIPGRMFLREPEEIEVRVGRDGVPRLFDDTVGSAVPSSEELPVVEVMSVRIRAKPAEFEIKEMSPETQLVGGPFVEGFGQEQRQFGEWHFELTPHKTGHRRIFIEVGGEVYAENGQGMARYLRPREFAIDVRVSSRLYFRRVMRLSGGLLGVLVTGIIGAMTQEMWWPKIREFFTAILG